MISATQRDHEFSIEDTGRSTEVRSSYLSQTLYLYDCLWSTTFGPNLLYAHVPQWFVTRLDRKTVSHERYYYILLLLLFIANIAISLTCHFGVNQPCPALQPLIVVNLVLASFFLVLNLLLCFFVSIPVILLYWIPDMAFVFRISDETSFVNKFFKLSLTQRTTHAAIDLERNVLIAAHLRGTASVDVMFYADSWYKKYILRPGIAIPIAVWCGFATCFYITTTSRYTVGQELYGFILVIGVWILAWIMICCIPIAKLLLAILNLFCCCIPLFLYKRICSSWVQAVQSRPNFVNEAAERVAFNGCS